MELTSPGVRYLSAIRSALDDIDDATRKLQASPNAGAVNICVAPAFLTHWLVPRVISFQQQYPDVELRLTASVNQIDLRYSDMDMAIFYGDTGHRLAKTKMCAVLFSCARELVL